MMRVPDNIDPYIKQKLHDVRRQVWLGGFKGLGLGTGLGISSYFFFKYNKALGVRMTPSTGVMLTLGLGCFGSYLGAVMYGKLAFSYLIEVMKHIPIEEKKPPDSLVSVKAATQYQTQLLQNDRELVGQMDEAFLRRAEAIRKAKEQEKGGNWK